MNPSRKITRVTKACLAVIASLPLVVSAQSAPSGTSPQADPAPSSAAKSETFSPSKHLGLTSAQASNVEDKSWAAAKEMETKLKDAVANFPDEEAPRAYQGRYYWLQGDKTKAQTILSGLNGELARKFLLAGAIQDNDRELFVKLYDDRPMCMYPSARDFRVQVAMESGKLDQAAQEIERCEKAYPDNHITRLMYWCERYSQPKWAHAELGKLAMRTPADEKGQVLLNRIFGEREKLKLLYPEQFN